MKIKELNPTDSSLEYTANLSSVVIVDGLTVIATDPIFPWWEEDLEVIND